MRIVIDSKTDAAEMLGAVNKLQPKTSGVIGWSDGNGGVPKVRREMAMNTHKEIV